MATTTNTTTSTLFISTSHNRSMLRQMYYTKKISNLSPKDIRKVMNTVSFPVMLPSNEERDNRFINDYQSPVIYDEGNVPLFNGTQRILVVTKFEKTLYYV